MKKEIKLDRFEKRLINSFFNMIYMNCFKSGILETRECIVFKNIIKKIIKDNFDLDIILLEKDIDVDFISEKTIYFLLNEEVLEKYECMLIRKILIEEKNIIFCIYYDDKYNKTSIKSNNEISIKAKIIIEIGVMK